MLLSKLIFFLLFILVVLFFFNFSFNLVVYFSSFNLFYIFKIHIFKFSVSA